jgi:hypothetical protein
MAKTKRGLSEAERRPRDRERLQHAARELLTSDGWQRWVRARALFHNYSPSISAGSVNSGCPLSLRFGHMSPKRRGPFPQADPSICLKRVEREHRRGDFSGGRVGVRGRDLFEQEQPPAGDLARERGAVADGEERVAVTVHHERRDRELG